MFWESVGNVIWFFIVFFIWVAFLMVLFSVIGDLFRSADLSGIAKTFWVVVLLFLPVLGTLLYLIVRGNGMSERAVQSVKKQQALATEYAQTVVGSGGPADQIEKAKTLLDAGAINQDEFNRLKAKALG